VNVAAEDADPTSMLALTRALTALRRSEPALHHGAYRSIDTSAREVFCFVRSTDNQHFLIALNLGHVEQRLDLSAAAARGTIVLATGVARQGDVDLTHLDLAGDEGLVIRLEE